MATLTIRNLAQPIHARLRRRAAEAGRSMEAEARAILAEACARPVAPEALQDYVDALYRPKRPRRVVAQLIAERRAQAKRE
jgi:plasmid stability protein